MISGNWQLITTPFNPQGEYELIDTNTGYLLYRGPISDVLIGLIRHMNTLGTSIKIPS